MLRWAAFKVVWMDVKLAKCRTWSRAVHHDRGLHVLLKSVFYKNAEGAVRESAC